MTRTLRAAILGLLMALAVAALIVATSSNPDTTPPGYRVPDRSLAGMKAGTADRPYVRRVLVPILLRAIDATIPAPAQAHAESRILTAPILRHTLWNRTPGSALDSLFCVALWAICFAIFAYTFETEATFYVELAAPNAPTWLPIAATLVTALAALALLRSFAYIYDPPTLAIAVLVLQAIRRERLLSLVVLTAIFSLNRETAFIIPGLVFFYWIHQRQPNRAFQQATVLSLVYLVVTAALYYQFRHNPGGLTENHRAHLFAVYLGKRLPFTVVLLGLLALYTRAVIRGWRALPSPLKAVQWFVPLWIILHILWGWPMELRVMFEVLPGMTLTALYLTTAARDNQSSSTPLTTNH